MRAVVECEAKRVGLTAAWCKSEDLEGAAATSAEASAREAATATASAES